MPLKLLLYIHLTLTYADITLTNAEKNIFIYNFSAYVSVYQRSSALKFMVKSPLSITRCRC